MARAPTLRTRIRGEVPHIAIEPARSRVSITMTPETEQKLETLRRTRGNKSKSEIVREALETEHRIRQLVEADLAADKLSSEDKDAFTKTRLITVATERLSIARNRKAVIQYSSVLIEALQDALDYDPTRHHNSPPPALRIEDQSYLTDLSALVTQLKRLNDLLEPNEEKEESAQAAVDVRECLNLFLKNYVPLLGKGSAALTVGVGAALLHSMGLGSGVVDQLLAHLPSFK